MESSACTFEVHCNECRRTTNHIQVGERWDKTEYYGLDICETLSWRLLRCAGCGYAVLNQTYCCSEDFDSDGQVLVHERFYPPREKRSPRIGELGRHVPDTIRTVYGEVIEAFNRDSLMLCALGLRLIVEGICADQGIQKGPKPDLGAGGFATDQQGNAVITTSLDGKIEGLAETGLLTRDQARWLHHHRFIGNGAAHDLEAPSETVLGYAIDVIEHVLLGLYGIPGKARSLGGKVKAAGSRADPHLVPRGECAGVDAHRSE